MTTIAERRMSHDEFRAWGTEVLLLVDHPEADFVEIAHQEIAAMDLACSRFRPDSELSRLNRARGRAVGVSPLFMEAVQTALWAARVTDGAVDPTVGEALDAIGYDRDIDEVRAADESLPIGRPSPVPGWDVVDVDTARSEVRLPPDVRLDLGATAKALTVDRVARRVADVSGAGTLFSIGGDIRVEGAAPGGGWVLGVTEDPGHGQTDPDCVICVTEGGVATSGTTTRSWRRSSRQLHHIVDPTTGWPARGVWRLVTICAASCVDANAAATAAVVWGDGAPWRIGQLGLSARFAHNDGTTFAVGGWPRTEWLVDEFGQEV